MSWGLTALIIVVLLLIFITIGTPVSFALGSTSLLGILVFIGPSALGSISSVAWASTNNFILTAVPLFFLMSEIITRSGVGRDLFDGIQKITQGISGGLAIATVIACALFGAVSGTGVGVAAMVGVIAIPEMLKRGYSTRIAAGSVAGASALGQIIPPSIPLILYAVVTEHSVGDLFIAGIVPGILLATLYAVYIMIATKMENKKELSHDRKFDEITVSVLERIKALVQTLPVVTLIAVIIGGIYTGIMTPTEAAGVGVLMSLIIAALYRRLTIQNVWSALTNATKTSSMVLLIIIASTLFGYLLASAQIPQQLSNWVTAIDASRWFVLAILIFVLVILGMFLDGGSIVLIAMPIFYPIITILGFDPIWFAIILMITLCIGVVSPPVGLVSYVVKDLTPEASMPEVFKASVPYIIINLAVIILLSIFPEIVTFLL